MVGVSPLLCEFISIGIFMISAAGINHYIFMYLKKQRFHVSLNNAPSYTDIRNYTYIIKTYCRSADGSHNLSRVALVHNEADLSRLTTADIRQQLFQRVLLISRHLQIKMTFKLYVRLNRYL